MDSAAQSETTQYIETFVTYILDFKKNVVFTSCVCLIIFLLTLSSGAYYYVYKSITDVISTRLPNGVNPGMIFFIIQILIFYSLFKLILNTLLDLIFIDRHSNEKYYCELKNTIDFVSNKIAGLFFGLYVVFLFPVYLSSNIASIYNSIIDSLKPLLEGTGILNNKSISKLDKSEKDIRDLQVLLNKEVTNFYKILKAQTNGIISTWFRDVFENIFIKKENKSQAGGQSLCECLKSSDSSSTKMSPLKSSEFKDDSSLIACQYSYSITIYFIILAIFYILLFILFPEATGIRMGIFVIVSLLVMRSMVGKYQFKLATMNIAIYKAVMKAINNNVHKKLWKEEKNVSRRFIGDVLSAFNPILRYIFGEHIANVTPLTKAFSIEDIVKCINIQCKEGENKIVKTLSNNENKIVKTLSNNENKIVKTLSNNETRVKVLKNMSKKQVFSLR
jgi:hypothetical protein